MQAEVVPGSWFTEAGWMKGYVQNGDWSEDQAAGSRWICMCSSEVSEE